MTLGEPGLEGQGAEGANGLPFLLGLSTFSEQPRDLHLGLDDPEQVTHTLWASVSVPLCEKRRLYWVILNLALHELPPCVGQPWQETDGMPPSVAIERVYKGVGNIREKQHERLIWGRCGLY